MCISLDVSFMLKEKICFTPPTQKHLYINIKKEKENKNCEQILKSSYWYT